MTGIEEIYKLYFKSVYSYTLSICRDEKTAEEIVSDTFFNAMNSLESFKGECDIRIWLFKIARNCVFSYFRKTKNLIALESLNEKADAFDTQNSVQESDESLRIHKILHTLEEPYKEVFSLRVFGELSFKEIGLVFGKTDNWACVTFHRAKEKIIKRLGE